MRLSARTSIDFGWRSKGERGKNQEYLVKVACFTTEVKQGAPEPLAGRQACLTLSNEKEEINPVLQYSCTHTHTHTHTPSAHTHAHTHARTHTWHTRTRTHTHTHTVGTHAWPPLSSCSLHQDNDKHWLPLLFSSPVLVIWTDGEVLLNVLRCRLTY